MATVMGSSGAVTPYFEAYEVNPEYGTVHEDDVTRAWQFFLQSYRAIERHPNARLALRTAPLKRKGEYDWPGVAGVQQALSRYGMTATEIRKQPLTVYTLQLGAYRTPRVMQQFIHHAYPPHDIEGNPGPMVAIYARTPKVFRFAYSGNGGMYKADPFYLEKHGRVTRVRYGVYGLRSDAARDARVFTARYGVRPLIVETTLNRNLIEKVLFGELPGNYGLTDGQ